MAKIKSGKNASKKDIILKKAALLFKTKGFNAASMRELAEAVGVEAPSLYNHIGSKSELLQAICFKVAIEFTTQLDETKNINTGITNKIELIIRFHITMMLEEFDEVFVANHEWKHMQEPYLSNFLNQRKSYEKRLIGIVKEGIKNKEIKKIEPQIIIFTILSAVRGLELWHRNKANISNQRLEDSMIAQLTTGFIK